jgi:hypothetical protein
MWGRRKRWHYWCVTSREVAVALTVADLDYLSFGASQVIPLDGGEIRTRFRARPFGTRLPDGPRTGVVRYGPFSIEEDERGARLRAPDFDVTIERPPGWAGLDVHAEIGPYSFKQPRLPARGEVQGGPIEGYACLDYGRGVWPARAEWRWASASGQLGGGESIGFNLGAIWTDRENALFVDDRVEKLGPVRFTLDDDTRIESDEVDLSLRVRARVKTPISEQRFGVWSGRVKKVSFDGVVGWAERFRTLW